MKTALAWISFFFAAISLLIGLFAWPVLFFTFVWTIVGLIFALSPAPRPTVVYYPPPMPRPPYPYQGPPQLPPGPPR